MSGVNQVVEFEGYAINVGNVVYVLPVESSIITVRLMTGDTITFTFDTPEIAAQKRSDLINILQDNE